MLDMQDRLKAPIPSLHLTATGGAITSPELIKKIRNTFKVEKPSVRFLKLNKFYFNCMYIVI